MRYSELLCVQLPATSSSTLYVLAAREPVTAPKQLNLGLWSANFKPPVSHVYLRPSPPSASLQLPPPLGGRILNSSHGRLYRVGGEVVELETIDELVYELFNDSYFIDKCALTVTATATASDGDGDGDSNHNAAGAVTFHTTELVVNGCGVSPEVRLLHPLSRLDPECQAQAASAPGPSVHHFEPSTAAQKLCTNCHPYIRLAIARSFLESHLPLSLNSSPSASASGRARLAARIQCTLVSYRHADSESDSDRSVSAPASTRNRDESCGRGSARPETCSEERVAFRRAVQHLGFVPIDVCTLYNTVH